MLKSLTIKNIALISGLTVEFGKGLTVLSGETGAGKSIIVDSLNLLLGAKTDRTLIRSGEQVAVAEGFFEVDYTTAQKIADLGIEIEAGELLLNRSINIDGKSECRVNGSLVTLSMLRAVSSLIVDIHGQHEHQSLLRPACHIDILDGYAKEPLNSCKARVSELYGQYREVLRELNSYGSDDDERARMIDILSYQINEIENASLKPDEFETLSAERTKHMNLERIINAVSAAYSALEQGATLVSEAKSQLLSASKYDQQLESLGERLDSCEIEIEDISDTLKDYVKNNEYDSFAADKIESRLELIKNIYKKYGGSFEAVGQFLEQAQKKYQKLTQSDEEIRRLSLKKEQIFSRLMKEAKELSALRKEAAKRFEEDVMRELATLGMAGSLFVVDFQEEQISSVGIDKVEFYLSANKGNPPKPLSKVASGGELSRVMLALKSITAQIDGIDTLIFDEIDTGISGKIGQVIAQKLADVSQTRQVITITHLASIAAMADRLYYIYKESDKEKTYTRLKACKEEDIIKEIARLSGAEGVSNLSIENAAQIRSWSLNYKQGKAS